MTLHVTIEPGPHGTSAVRLGSVLLASGPGAVVCQAARVLVNAGWDPATVWLVAWRGPTLCLSGLLGNFARVRVQENTATGVPRFVRWTPHPLDGPARYAGGPQADAVATWIYTASQLNPRMAAWSTPLFGRQRGKRA